ncbi:MAG: FRG domain-containing protein [Synergistes sp.]|nr:FRG domain-containing protein [Synergistes sp.]
MINSFGDYWNEIKGLLPNRSDEMLFLRGQSNGNWKQMLPGIMRKDGDEFTEYRNIQVDYPEEFKKHEHLSNLVKMQHYGCSTRLLDFTLNPLVALFFACEQDEDVDGKVFIIKVKKKEILFQNSDKALMLSCLPAFSKEEKEQIRVFCENHRGKITDSDIKSSHVMQKFLHEIRGEYPAFETAIIGEHLLSYFFLRSHKDNERIKVQDGAFAIFGLNEREAVNEINRKAKIISIASSAKRAIIKDLDILRVNESTIYPGLERRAMLNRNKKTVRSLA